VGRGAAIGSGRDVPNANLGPPRVAVYPFPVISRIAERGVLRRRPEAESWVWSGVYAILIMRLLGNDGAFRHPLSEGV